MFVTGLYSQPEELTTRNADPNYYRMGSSSTPPERR